MSRRTLEGYENIFNVYEILFDKVISQGKNVTKIDDLFLNFWLPPNSQFSSIRFNSIEILLIWKIFHHIIFLPQLLWSDNLSYLLINQPTSKSQGGGFSKKNWKFCRTFFSGQLNWFSELSQITLKTLIWQNFLRRRQICEKKTGRKGVFMHFLENFDQKNCGFSARAPSLKIGID